MYLNFGREADFQALTDLGVAMSGKIGLARQGQSSATDQVTSGSFHGVGVKI